MPCYDRNHQVFYPPTTSFSSQIISLSRCAPLSCACTGGRSDFLLLDRNPLACTALPLEAVQSGFCRTVDEDFYSLTIQPSDLRSAGCMIHPQQCFIPIKYVGTNALSNAPPGRKQIRVIQETDNTRCYTSFPVRIYSFENRRCKLDPIGSQSGNYLCRKGAQGGTEYWRPAKLL